MNKIIEKTYELIDCLDKSDIIKNLVYYKERAMKDKRVLELVKKYNNTKDNAELIKIKIELYSNQDYKNYMDNYNKLNNIIMKINYRYKKLLNSRSCNNAGN